MTEREQLEQAIVAQEALRTTLGDEVVDAIIAVLREKLAEISIQAVSDQRKLVTILFADTVASTAMSQHLDPEDVLEIMDGALKAYTEVVNVMGGTVARLMGDGLLAFFGAPIGREDDAVRAVRCGLDIVRAAQTYAREVEARWNVASFNVRVGINTGLVALGEVGGAAGSEYTAMGDAINLASRLESSAPPGGVMISHDTYIHVRGIFEMRTLEPIQFKGKDEPIQVYLVEREKPRTFRVTTRGVEGIETRMVGRESEMQQLQDAMHWAIEEGETQVVTIVGEPGVGKSRLLREFDDWIDELPLSVLHFTGRATLEMLSLPYSLIRNLFAFRFEIHDSDSVAIVRQKMERGVMGFMGVESAHKAHYIGHLIGFDFSNSPYLQGDDPQLIAQLGLYYITEFFGAAAADTPAVMLLDDIHWADDKSLDVINHIVRSLRQLKLLVLCLARPTLFERRPPLWTDKHEFHTTIELRPLTKSDSRQLVEQIFCKVETVPEDLRDLIVNSADGNPFYVEELIKMLIDDGVIVKGTEQWWIEDERLTDLRIPPTLTGVLQARLDALPPSERTLLQRASVVGRIFWDQAIINMFAEDDLAVENPRDGLSALRRRELIRGREQSAFYGAEEYIFKHAILRDVTYESVLRRLRRIYHAQVADWLVERAGDRINEYTGLIADHYERAGQAEKALTYLNRAGEQALNISAYRDAISRLERALVMVQEIKPPDKSVQEAEIKLLLGQAYRGLSAYPKAKELYEESLILFHEAKNNPGIVKALYDLGWLLGLILRRHDEGQQYFQESLLIAREIEDKRGISWALNGLGAMAHWQGKHAEAIRYYKESLGIAREIGDWPRISGALNNIGLIEGELGHYNQAHTYLEESLEISKKIGRRVGITSSYTNLGGLARAEGQHEEAQKYFEEALRIQKEIGDRAGIAASLYGLGSLARLKGDYQQAKAHYGESLTIFKEIYYPAGIGSSLEDLALVARLQGNYIEARNYLQQELEVAREVGDLNETANALLNLGAVECVQKHFREAKEFLNESLKINTEMENRKGLARTHLYLGQVALGLNQYDAASEAFSEGLAIYRDFDNRTGIVTTLGGLGDVAVGRNEYETARQYLHEAFSTASALHDTPLTLWVLSGIAALLAKEGEKERSVELLGLILDHYATPQEARDKASTVIRELDADLSEPLLAEALERGKGMALDAMEAAKRRLGMDESQRWLT
jgi:class 3 adenylate cyclase/tetratricopeptide (TPR) repeat protein